MSYVRRMQPWLGTFVEIGVEAGPTAQREIRTAFSEIEKVHRLLSYQEPDSDLSRLNRADGEPVDLDALTVTVLRLARAVMRASGGRFDCTVGGTLERIGALSATVGPAPLGHGEADDIVILGRRTARLRRPIRITLDGIAKGYAVDRAISALRAHGAASAWVNAGGDLRVVGSVPTAIALRSDNGYRLAGHIADCAVATSVVSAQPDERFPARIVSTTGATVRHGAWTVLARRAWRADALTKVAPLLPAAQRAATIARLGGRLLNSAAWPA